jgi:hypothetical protein
MPPPKKPAQSEKLKKLYNWTKQDLYATLLPEDIFTDVLFKV